MRSKLSLWLVRMSLCSHLAVSAFSETIINPGPNGQSKISSTIKTSTRTSTNSFPPVVSSTSSPTSTTCPDFWTALVSDLASSMRTPNGQCNNIARASIRFAFHDAAAFSSKLPFYAPAAGGADGSLLLSPTEILRKDNEGLQSYHTFLTSKFHSYQKTSNNALTAADLIQIAGATGILACPGGRIGRVFVGRKDTSRASPENLLPQAFGPGSDHNSLLNLFSDKGFSPRDLAALIGAHSTSIARFQSQFGIPVGTPQDSTPGVWDTKYYREVYNNNPPVSGVGRFESDVNLSRNLSKEGVGVHFRGFVDRQAEWGDAFARAWERLSLLGVEERGRGEMGDCTEVVGRAFL